MIIRIKETGSINSVSKVSSFVGDPVNINKRG